MEFIWFIIGLLINPQIQKKRKRKLGEDGLVVYLAGVPEG